MYVAVAANPSTTTSHTIAAAAALVGWLSMGVLTLMISVCGDAVAFHFLAVAEGEPAAQVALYDSSAMREEYALAVKEEEQKEEDNEAAKAAAKAKLCCYKPPAPQEMI